MVTLFPGEAAWTELASLPRSLYAPRASLVGRRMRVTGGRSTGGRRDYRAEVIMAYMYLQGPSSVCASTPANPAWLSKK